MKTRLRQRFPSTQILLLSLFIAAIGFGCGGGGGGAPTYTIGGSVTGLTGTGFVLQNNGGNDLSVSSSKGRFTFTTGLTSNTSYSVSIKTQPTNQICTIASGSGTVASSNVSTVNISCTLKNQDASGLYNGSGTVAFVNVKNKAPLVLKTVKGIINKNRFIFFNINAANFLKGIQDDNVLIDGTITSITKTVLKGTANIYQAGQIVSKKVSVSGIVTERGQISLTLAATTAEVGAPAGDFLGGSVQGMFDLQYDNTASDAIIDSPANKYWGSNLSPYEYMVIPNMQSGDFNMSPSDNTYENVARDTSNININICVFSGVVSIPNNKINIYTLVENKVFIGKGCAGIGNTLGYTGLASVLSITNTNDTLWYAVSNGTYSVYALLDRVP